MHGTAPLLPLSFLSSRTLVGANVVMPVSTVAVSRTTDVLAAGGNQALALTEGFQSAFAACIALTAAGALFALATLGRARSVPAVDALEPIPEPARD